MIALMMIIAFQGFAFGQGLLDSILGPGGLGIWGGGSDQQFNPQGTYGSQPGPQQYYQPPGQQQYQQQYGAQQGVYPDWYNQSPAVAGTPGVQYGGVPQQYSDQQPQYQQSPPQQYQQYPQQQQYQMQYPPQQGYAQPPQQYASPQQGAPQVQQQQLRPGQYSSNQPPPGPGQMSADDLPSGAVRIMTTTPDGTTVQYYPPAGDPDAGTVAPQQQRRTSPKPARQRQTQQQTSTSAPQTQQGTAPIAMPKPVEPPKQDPRYGWGAQSAPTVR
jgi:hypothetical protein